MELRRTGLSSTVLRAAWQFVTTGIAIRRTFERVSDPAPVYGVPQTTRSGRTVVLPVVALDALRHRTTDQNLERLASGPN